MVFASAIAGPLDCGGRFNIGKRAIPAITATDNTAAAAYPTSRALRCGSRTRSASATSLADWYRNVGSYSRQRLMTSPQCLGQCLGTSALTFEAAEGRFPVAISY